MTTLLDRKRKFGKNHDAPIRVRYIFIDHENHRRQTESKGWITHVYRNGNFTFEIADGSRRGEGKWIYLERTASWFPTEKPTERL